MIKINRGLKPVNLSLVYAIFSCADEDECELGLDDCDENANCTSTVGSDICTCREGYCGDGRNCTGELCCELLKFS